jgi:septum site-determining protein MinD
MARRIVITSGKGGVGKTTVCANLGVYLSRLGFRVVLIDVDIGLNNLDVIMGLERQVVFDLTDVVMGKCRVRQALVQDPNYPSLYVLPSSHTYASCKISGEHIKNVCDVIDHSFDYILIDCPAGVEAGFQRAVFPANEAIIVVTPHLSSIKDADKVVGLLSGIKSIENKGLVINRMRGDLLLSGQMLDIESIVKSMDIPLLGVVPEDDKVSKMSCEGRIMTDGESVRAFTLLAENVHNGCRKIYDCTYKYRGALGYLKRNIKKYV